MGNILLTTNRDSPSDTRRLCARLAMLTAVAASLSVQTQPAAPQLLRASEVSAVLNAAALSISDQTPPPGGNGCH